MRRPSLRPPAPEGAADSERNPLSAKQQARQAVRELRQALGDVADEILQGGEIALWASELLANKFDQSIEDLKELLELPFLLTEAEQKSVSRRLAEAQAAQDPPKTLAELQTPPTENMEGYDLHHIVQQNDDNVRKDKSQMRIEKFGRDRIDSPENLVWVPRLKHQLITGYYNEKILTGTGYKLRRQIVGDLDFDAQYQDGLSILQLFGVLQ